MPGLGDLALRPLLPLMPGSMNRNWYCDLHSIPDILYIGKGVSELNSHSQALLGVCSSRS